MHRKKKIGFFLLAIFYAFFGYIIAVNVFNIPDGVFNKPDPDFFQRFPIFYPSYNGKIGTSNQVIIEVNVSASGRLVEGKTATISAVGSASPPLANNITDVSLTFEGAEPAYNTSYTSGLLLYSPNFGRVDLVPNNNCPTHPTGVTLDLILCGSATNVIWPIVGAYAAFLSIDLNNGKSLNETLSGYKISVLSISFAQTEQSNRINLAFSAALVSFGVLEGVNIVHELTEEKRKVVQTVSSLPKRDR
ncbi:hypothetical protein AUI06_10650 [archaeon 13_2_20CM_2_52_21]|nr:MAG: hypothetical protein AUI06_10650 [archaeon 13_2_20CM_2_52_21]